MVSRGQTGPQLEQGHYRLQYRRPARKVPQRYGIFVWGTFTILSQTTTPLHEIGSDLSCEKCTPHFSLAWPDLFGALTPCKTLASIYRVHELAIANMCTHAFLISIAITVR